MTIDKRMRYEMQGGTKPARNYLGTQKTVSGVPVKWKSGPDAPSTELAYITKAEKDLLLKKNLHGSLKNGPNTGPDGIMSLDSQGDYSPDRSRSSRSPSSQASQAHMKSILTGQKNIGQTTKTGPKTRKYAVPEYAKVKQKDGTYKNKYIGSGYKSYGQPSFFGNLFSRGAPGYRGIKGMPAFGGKPGFGTTGTTGKGGTLGYYSDNEDFGETRDALPNFGIMGLIQGLVNKFKKPPQDMSEFNKLTLGGTHPAALDFDPDAKIQDTAFSKTLSDKYKYGVGPVPPSDKYKYSDGPRAVNVPDSPEWTSWEVPPGMVSDAAQENVEFFDNLNKGIVKNNNTPMLNTDNLLQGSVIDQVPEKSMMEKLSDFYQNNSFNPFKMSEAGAAELTKADIEKAGGNYGFFGANDELEAMQEYYNAAKGLTAPEGKFAGATNPNDVRSFIQTQSDIPFMGGSYQIDMDKVPANFMNLTTDFTNQKSPYSFWGKAKGGRVGYANGGLASLFTRRG